MSAPVALTCGEPAGIGPEIAAKAWDALRGHLPFVWIGDPRHLPSGTPVIEIASLDGVNEACARALPVLPHAFASPSIAGTPQADHAVAVISAIARGVELVRSGAASALCTAPINKKALKDGANFPHPGHTEYLAALAGVDDVVMMLSSDVLKVVPVTIHVGLAEVPNVLTADRLRKAIVTTHAALIRDFGIAAPRLSVAGLNPHAGEGGTMGREEIDLIGPLVRALAAKGMAITGPHSADTMFHEAARARYDAAICMYHDQALIPIKTLDFAGGVNVTLGLPFIRTSPDHGTAFDIAGKGCADPSSLIAALELASRMATARARRPSAPA